MTGDRAPRNRSTRAPDGVDNIEDCGCRSTTQNGARILSVACLRHSRRPADDLREYREARARRGGRTAREENTVADTISAVADLKRVAAELHELAAQALRETMTEEEKTQARFFASSLAAGCSGIHHQARGVLAALGPEPEAPSG